MLCSIALQGRCCAVLPCKEDVQYFLARKMLCSTSLQGRCCAILPCKEEAQQACKCCTAKSTSQRLLHVQMPHVLLQQYQYGLTYCTCDVTCRLRMFNSISAAQHLGTGSDGSADTTLCRRQNLREFWLSAALLYENCSCWTNLCGELR